MLVVFCGLTLYERSLGTFKEEWRFSKMCGTPQKCPQRHPAKLCIMAAMPWRGLECHIAHTAAKLVACLQKVSRGTLKAVRPGHGAVCQVDEQEETREQIAYRQSDPGYHAGLPDNISIPPPRPKRKPSHPYPKKLFSGSMSMATEGGGSQDMPPPRLPDYSHLAPKMGGSERLDVAVAAVAQAASAAAAAAAAAVISAAGEQIRAHMQVSLLDNPTSTPAALHPFQLDAVFLVAKCSPSPAS